MKRLVKDRHTYDSDWDYFDALDDACLDEDEGEPYECTEDENIKGINHEEKYSGVNNLCGISAHGYG